VPSFSPPQNVAGGWTEEATVYVDPINGNNGNSGEHYTAAKLDIQDGVNALPYYDKGGGDESHIGQVRLLPGVHIVSQRIAGANRNIQFLGSGPASGARFPNNPAGGNYGGQWRGANTVIQADIAFNSGDGDCIFGPDNSFSAAAWQHNWQLRDCLISCNEFVEHGVVLVKGGFHTLCQNVKVAQAGGDSFHIWNAVNTSLYSCGGKECGGNHIFYQTGWSPGGWMTPTTYQGNTNVFNIYDFQCDEAEGSALYIMPRSGTANGVNVYGMETEAGTNATQQKNIVTINFNGGGADCHLLLTGGSFWRSITTSPPYNVVECVNAGSGNPQVQIIGCSVDNYGTAYRDNGRGIATPTQANGYCPVVFAHGGTVNSW
jgi:hypothetical protein